jgi:DNA polymerase-4
MIRRADLDANLLALVDRLTRRLRAAHRVCRTVTFRLRFDDLSRATRSHTVEGAIAGTVTLPATARLLLAEALPTIEARGCTLIGLTFTNLLRGDAVQLALPLEGPSASVIDATLDAVRDRYEAKAVTRGVLLGRHEGLRVPLLQD